MVGDWEDYRSINVDGTRNVLHAAQRRGIGRVVYVSSPSVAHGGEPIVGGRADEPVLGRRRAWYPESKAMAEIEALAAADDELGVVAIRPHLVWGPGDTQLVGRIVERAAAGRLALVGGGRALVDTTYIDNAVDSLVAALDVVEPGARCSGRAYVVSNGEPRMIRELVEGICHAAGVPFEPRTVSLRVGRSLGAVVERAWPLRDGTTSHRSRSSSPSSSARHTGSTRVRPATTSGGRRWCRSTRAWPVWPTGTPPIAIALHRERVSPLSSAPQLATWPSGLEATACKAVYMSSILIVASNP